MRHGEAVMTTPDEARELTDRGVVQVQQQARQLLQQQLLPDHILASPLTRAQQTASLMANILSSRVTTSTFSSLTPNGKPQAVLTDLDNLQGDSGCLLLVSHLPLVAILASFLTEGHEQRAFTFMTADVVELKTDAIAAGCCDFVRQYRV